MNTNLEPIKKLLAIVDEFPSRKTVDPGSRDGMMFLQNLISSLVAAAPYIKSALSHPAPTQAADPGPATSTATSTETQTGSSIHTPQQTQSTGGTSKAADPTASISDRLEDALLSVGGGTAVEQESEAVPQQPSTARAKSSRGAPRSRPQTTGGTASA